MPALLDLQRRFRAALLGGAEAAPPPEVLGGRVDAAARLAIYRGNVIGNLTGALRLTYPAIERLVGAAFFTGACASFVVASPPDSADLYEYGAGFAAFLEAFAPARTLPYLADVARLEYAVTRALHAPLVPPMDAAALASVPAAAEDGLRFLPHPALSLLDLAHPAAAIWEAVLTEAPEARAARLSAIDLDAGGAHLAVLRGAEGPEFLALSPAAFALAGALAGGVALGAALDRVPATEAASCLGVLLTQGFFAGWRVSGDRSPDGPIAHGPGGHGPGGHGPGGQA